MIGRGNTTGFQEVSVSAADAKSSSERGAWVFLQALPQKHAVRGLACDSPLSSLKLILEASMPANVPSVPPDLYFPWPIWRNDTLQGKASRVKWPLTSAMNCGPL